MHLILRDQQHKINIYRERLLYVNLMVTTNKKRKIFKHNIEDSYQITRKMSKRIRKEHKELQNNQKTNLIKKLGRRTE